MEKTKGFFFHLSVNPTLCSVVPLDCASQVRVSISNIIYNWPYLMLIRIIQDKWHRTRLVSYSSATMFCLAKPITLQSFPENKSILTIMVQPHNDKRHIVYMCINACIVVVYSEISYERESCMGTWTPQSIRGVSKRYWSLFNSRVERGFNKMQLKNHWETMENMA